MCNINKLTVVKLNFVKFKNLAKHPWSMVTLSKVDTKLYPENSRMLPQGTILDSRHASKKWIISMFKIVRYALKKRYIWVVGGRDTI